MIRQPQVLAKALVLPELLENKLSLDDQKLLHFGHTIAQSVDVLAFSCSLSAAAAAFAAAAKIYVVSSRSPISKRLSSRALAMLLSGLSVDYDVVLASESGYFHDALCGAGAVLNKSVVSGVYEVLKDGVFVRSACADRLAQHVVCNFSKPWLVSVKLTHVIVANQLQLAPAAASLQVLDCNFDSNLEVLSCVKSNSSIGCLPLADAKVVIAGGRSFGSAEAFSRYLVPLAAKLNAAIGATRAAVDAGYAPAECQIGQTGQIIAPRLYVAFGISGSSHHMMGVRRAQTVVAVNLDAGAPIMAQADFGLVADMFEVIPKVMSKLSLV